MAIGKVLVGGSLLLGLGLAVFGGGGKGKGRARFTTPIPSPGQGMPWTAVDEAMCLCWEAGERERGKLAGCVLARLWPDVPWPAMRGDHETVMLTSNLVHDRAGSFIQAIDAGQFPCAEMPPEPEHEDIIIPGEVEPTDPANDPSHPFFWLKTDGRPASFRDVKQGDNPTLVARSVFDFGQGHPQTVNVLRCIAGTGWNLFLYSRTRDAGTFGAVKVGSKWYDIGPAYLPRNDDAIAAFANLVAPVRTVNRQGGKAGNGTTWGTPWIPDMTLVQDTVVCPDGTDPWAPSRNPPPQVLERLGLTLAAMRQAWESQAA